MNPRVLLEALSLAAKLKDTTRHSYTEKGRHESVAEHSWMMTLMAFFMKDEFPEADMGKVIRMCIIHDLGEAFTGDIPAFEKSDSNEQNEEKMLYDWVNTLPQDYADEMLELYDEMAKRETVEAKIYKAIDGLEALIQHNSADLSTWIPLEYELNKTYADDKVDFSQYLKVLREEVRKDTLKKIEEKSCGDMVMKEHIMNLTPSPLKMIKEGKKTIELRLYDEKRKMISIGDTITFVNTEDSVDTLRVKVKGLYVFDSFDELYKSLDLLQCGYTEDDINTASPRDMELYYSREKQSQFGVIGIKISLV